MSSAELNSTEPNSTKPISAKLPPINKKKLYYNNEIPITFELIENHIISELACIVADYLIDDLTVSDDWVYIYESGSQELIQNKVKLSPEPYYEAIEITAEYGDIETINTMIKSGRDWLVNSWQKGIEIACRIGRLDIVKLLMEEKEKDFLYVV